MLSKQFALLGRACYDAGTQRDEEEEEIRQGYLEIREVSGGRVVTVIEVVSPANKAAGSRVHQTYLRKQADVLASDANLVEIDLLRRGTHVLAVPESCLERVRP